MKFKLLVLFLILPFVAFLVFNPIKSAFAQSAPASDAQVNIVGDSLTEGAKSNLQQLLPNAVIDSVVGRPFADGISTVSQLKANGQLKPLLVFALGTNNSSLSSGDIDNLLSAAADSKIILVTTYNATHPDWATNVNAILNAAANAHADRIKIADWNSMAAANPSLIDNSDGLGVHPTSPEGRQAFAKVVSDAVAGTGPSGPGAPGQTAVSNCVITKIGDTGDRQPALPPSCPADAAGYTNPFPGGWVPSRLDWGEDGTFTGQIVAPFSGTITYASNSFSNWGGYIELKADQKPNALPTSTLYFAEGLSYLVTAGKHVNAGQPIANPAISPWNGINGNIEWGVAQDGGGVTDTYALIAPNPKQMVLDFATWTQQTFHHPPPTETLNAGYP